MLFLFLTTAFCPFRGTEWFCVGADPAYTKQARQHFFPLSKRRISPQIPHQAHSFTQLFWYNWEQCRGRNSLSGSYHTVLPLPWLRSFCLPPLSLQVGSNIWLQRIKRTENLLQPKTLSLPINSSTHGKEKKRISLFWKNIFSFFHSDSC